MIKYSSVYWNGGNNMGYVENVRYEMVKLAKEIGIKPTARKYGCSKNTVKEWVKRYNEFGKNGLKDLSKRPKNSPKQICEKDIKIITEAVIEAKEKKKYITVKNIRKKTKITTHADETINRYINKACGKVKNPKKTKTNGKSIAFKKNLKPFEIMQIDIKYLTDIDNLKPYFDKIAIQKGLALYQITFRDVASGLPIVAYCYEKSVYNTNIFLEKIVLPFLKQFNIDLKKCTIQTDNGTEFSNNYIAVKNGNIPKDTKFTLTIKQNFKKHRTIIPGHCTADSEVESFHWSIERDCLAWEDIIDNDTLIKYVTKYIDEYRESEIKIRGYSPLTKLKEHFEMSNITFPSPVIIEHNDNISMGKNGENYTEIA